MSVEIGDVVKFKDSGSRGEIGRVCKDHGISVSVQFKSTGCLRVRKNDLEPATGKAPECAGNCK